MTFTRSPERILVVEDDDNIATAIEYLVGREGMVYDRVANGAEAVRRIRETRPDLVLLDIMLPEVSGYDICRDVRGDPALAATRILMMTARGSANEQIKAMAAGADGYIAKPFEVRHLRGELRRILGPESPVSPAP